MVDPLNLHAEIRGHGAVPGDRGHGRTGRRLSTRSCGQKNVPGPAVVIEGTVRSESPRRGEAAVVVDMRSEPIVADGQEATTQAACNATRYAVERLVRQRRQMLGESWKRQDLKAPEDG